MGKGRKPISNALKVLKGTDQPCRMREEISYEKITKIPKIPKAPDYMCIAGKKVYKITAQQLADQGILNVVNINAVMMYANERGKYIEAEKKLSEPENDRVVKEISDKGGVRYVRNPLDKMASEYLANAKMWAVELGITPASASKVKMGEKKEKDPLQKLLEDL
ncbi:MAG: phage terminase small subunit P27 family [Odoribacter splanchnicus]